MKRLMIAGLVCIAGFFLLSHAAPAEAPAPAKDKAAKKIALIDQAKCVKCGTCFKVCPVKAISKIEKDKKVIYVVDPKKCVGCGTCIKKCPTKAISWAPPVGSKPDSSAAASDKTVPPTGAK